MPFVESYRTNHHAISCIGELMTFQENHDEQQNRVNYRYFNRPRTPDDGAPPFRLALGSKAYRSINEALNSRLQVLEDTRALALSADKDA